MYLDLQKCYEVTDATAGLLAAHNGGRLVHLNLRLCFKITSAGVKALATASPRLQFLDLRCAGRAHAIQSRHAPGEPATFACFEGYRRRTRAG
jgi:hypothetical protein